MHQPYPLGTRHKFRRVMSLIVALGALAGVTGCERSALVRETTALEKPAPLSRPIDDEPIPLGRESAYYLVNSGNFRDANDLLRDVWNIPRFAPTTLKTPFDCHVDPYRDRYWRFIFSSMRPTSNLLWAYYRSGKLKYRDKLIEMLRSFASCSPTASSSGLAADEGYALAFRAMVLVNTYIKLRRSQDLPRDLETRLLQEIERSGAGLACLSNYQSTYSHGFTQAAALLLVSSNFPELSQSAGWGSTALTRLNQLMITIVDEDGVEMEKSPFHHFQVFDWALQLMDWARVNDVQLPKPFGDQVGKMIDYATQVAWPNKAIPRLGASVELRAKGDSSLYADLMGKYPEFAYAMSGGARGTPPRARARRFPASGQVVLRSSQDLLLKPEDNSQLLMDVGPPKGEHSHHEALAFNYYSRGRELVVDSGIDTDPKGAAYSYFHRAVAHNTLIVDGQDQTTNEVRAGSTLTGDEWAYQSGVSGAYEGVTHRRAVLLLRRDLVMVVDAADGSQEHTFEQLWHLFPEAHVVVDRTTTRVFDQYDNPVLDIAQAPTGAESHPRQYHGARNPMRGWYSAAYGATQPNHLVSYPSHGKRAVHISLLASGPYAGAGVNIRGTVRGDRVEAVVRAGKYQASVNIENIAGEGETVTVNTTGKSADGR